MRKYPSNPKYIKVEVRVGPIMKGVIKIKIIGPRQSYKDNNFRENTRGYGRQNSRGEYGE